MKTLIFTLLFYIISVFSKSISTRDHWRINGFAHKLTTWQLSSFFVTIEGYFPYSYNCTYTNHELCQELTSTYGGLDRVDDRLKDICNKVYLHETCDGSFSEALEAARSLYRELLRGQKYSLQECIQTFGLCSILWPHYSPLVEVCEQMMIACFDQARQDAASRLLLRGSRKTINDPELFKGTLKDLCYKLGDMSPDLRHLCVNWESTWDLLKKIANEECPQLEEDLTNALRTFQVTKEACQLLSRCDEVGDCNPNVKRKCMDLRIQCLTFRYVDGSAAYDTSVLTEYEVRKFFLSIYQEYGVDIQPHDYASEFPEDPSLSLMLYDEGNGPFDPSCPVLVGQCGTHYTDSYLLYRCGDSSTEREALCDNFRRRMDYDNPHSHVHFLYDSFANKNTSAYHSDGMFSSSFYGGYDRDFCRKVLADCLFYGRPGSRSLRHNCDRAKLICQKKSTTRLLVKGPSDLLEEDDFIERKWCKKRLAAKCTGFKNPDYYTISLCLHPGDTCNVYDY